MILCCLKRNVHKRGSTSFVGYSRVSAVECKQGTLDLLTIFEASIDNGGVEKRDLEDRFASCVLGRVGGSRTR